MSKVAQPNQWSEQFRSSFQEFEVNPLEEGATALMYACQQENLEQLKEILQKKPNAVREKDRTLKTVLHYCAENAAVQCAETVLNAAPDLLDEADEDGYTTLHLAVIAGNIPLVNFLISKSADVNKLDLERHSVIHWATVCVEVELLELLLKCKANPSTPDIHGGYPVHYAAQMCGVGSEIGNDSRHGLAVLRTLLSHHVDVNVLDHDGRQPLLWAASAGSSDAVLSLINAGASVKVRDKDGLTAARMCYLLALHCAASRGHIDCLETLVELCGADVDVMDSNGCTALFYSVTLGHADATQLLLGYGANPNRQDRKGRTPAHCGAAKGQLETLKILNKHGADLWTRNMKGDYPLHEAVNSGRKELVCWLLSQRPDSVNSSNCDGRCPLHIAAINNNVEMCKIILDHQSLVNPIMRTSKGDLMTPLDAALYRSNRGCAKYLQLHGGVPSTKLTSFTAALRGPHRPDAHTDYHITQDVTVESQGQSSRTSRSLNASPLSGYQSSRSKKVQVHIDVSSETVDEKRPSKSQHEKHATRKLRRKTSKYYREDEFSDIEDDLGIKKGSKKFEQKDKILDSESVTDGSDYTEYSTESEYQRKRRSYHKDKRKRREDRRLQRRTVNYNQTREDMSNGGNESNEENYRRSGSRGSRTDKSPKSEKLLKRDRSPKNGKSPKKEILPDICKREEEPMEKGKTSSEQVVTVMVHRENGPEAGDKVEQSETTSEKTDSNSCDPIQYRKLETDTDATSGGIEEKQNRQEKNLNFSDKAKAESTMQEKMTQVLDNEKDAFGETPFTDNIKEEQKQEKNIPVKSKDEKTDTTECKSDTDEVLHQHEIQNYDTEEIKEDKPQVALLNEKLQRTDEDTKYNLASVSSKDKVSEVMSKVEETNKIDIQNVGDKAENKSESDLQVDGETKQEQREKEKIESETSSIKGQNVTKTEPEIIKGNEKKQGEMLPKLGERGEVDGNIINNEDSLTENKEETRQTNNNLTKEKQEKLPIGEKEQSIKITEETTTKNDSSRLGTKSIKKEIVTKTKTVKMELMKVEQKGKKKLATVANEEHYEKYGKEKGLVCILPDDSEEGLRNENGLCKAQNGKPRSRSFSGNRIRSGDNSNNYNKRRSRSSFEVLSDNDSLNFQERSQSQLGFQDDSGFEPSPRHSHTTSTTEDASSRSRIPRAKSRFASYDKNGEPNINVTSVTQAVQNSVRKYHLERRIFNTLLELKRLQIRAGKANEQVAVKRLVDDYQKAGLVVGLRQYDGTYSFRHFERYLYEQLRRLQSAERKIIPRIKSSDDFEKLTKALKRTRAGKTLLENVPDNPLFCTHGTHRCIHATHAYTGIPCAAYISKINHHQFPKEGEAYRCFLPRIDTKSANKKQCLLETEKSIRNVDPSKPVTLELIHGSEKQTISLPTDKLDKNKRYYVTFTIKGNSDLKKSAAEIPDSKRNRNTSSS